jgi:hypothetical protein
VALAGLRTVGSCLVGAGAAPSVCAMVVCRAVIRAPCGAEAVAGCVRAVGVVSVMTCTAGVAARLPGRDLVWLMCVTAAGAAVAAVAAGA